MIFMADHNADNSLMTLDELCETLMIGRTAAYRLMKTGAIKCFKIGRVWKIPHESVTEYIEQARCHSF